MTEEKQTCPKCRNVMELRETESGPFYICFVCEHRLSLARVRDSQRWWGLFHLPVLDLLVRPASAFEQLRNHPLPLTSLVFFALSVGISSHRSSSLLYAFGVALGVETLLAGLVHQLSLIFGGQGKFFTLWAALLYITAEFRLLQVVVPTGSALVHGGLTGWKIILIVRAVEALYGFSIVEAGGACLLAELIKIVLLVIFGLQPSWVPSGFLHQLGRHLRRSPAAIVPVHVPADYSLELRTLDRKPFRLSEARGKVIFLNFWATWCGPCRMELPSIQRLYDHFKNDPAVVFLVASDEDTPTLQHFLARTHYDFPVYRYGPVPPVYSSPGIPLTFILSSDGWIVARVPGAMPWDTPQAITFLKALEKTRGKKNSSP